MKKFWGFYSNGKYSVGCNGATVYIYDCNGVELARFKDFPYAYKAAFLPNSNIIAVKSTEGYLGFYDLDALKLVKKVVVTRIGAQDGGFAFSPDGAYFYNIEAPTDSTRSQLGIYETSSFTKTDTLFAENAEMVLMHVEFDAATGICYLLGFMRGDDGVIAYGFTAIFDPKDRDIRDIHSIEEKCFDDLCDYKSWELSGFTAKALEWNYVLKDLSQIPKTSIKEVHEGLPSAD